jgi:putative SOS response-associated peptidase YedK
MCGRFALYADKTMLELFLGISLFPGFSARYNLAPSQSCLFIKGGTGRNLSPSYLSWGLIPAWAKDKSMAGKMINARAETITEKPSFKSAFNKRRGIIPANGFYEWKTTGKSKTPFFISPKDQSLLGFGGIWESNTHLGEETTETFSIITTAANQDMNELHERMPLIIPRGSWKTWLNHEGGNSADIAALLQPAPSGFLQLKEVRTLVNKVANDSPECLLPPARDLFSDLD